MKIDFDFEMDRQETMNMDSMFLVLCMQIAEDYDTILRQHVMPEFKHCEGLNLREMRVLRCVARAPLPMTNADIADRLRYDPATVTRALKRLGASQKITRRPCPTDQRSDIIEITETGRAISERYRDQYRHVIKLLSEMQTDRLSQTEVEQFINIGRKLSRRVHNMSQIKPREYIDFRRSA